MGGGREPPAGVMRISTVRGEGEEGVEEGGGRGSGRSCRSVFLE